MMVIFIIKADDATDKICIYLSIKTCLFCFFLYSAAVEMIKVLFLIRTFCILVYFFYISDVNFVFLLVAGRNLQCISCQNASMLLGRLLGS